MKLSIPLSSEKLQVQYHLSLLIISCLGNVCQQMGRPTIFKNAVMLLAMMVGVGVYYL
jgi:hypothetical protein